ncbi:MAG: T9SS type A sorting domain-containing protein, partial [Bacteroidota bacterium]
TTVSNFVIIVVTEVYDTITTEIFDTTFITVIDSILVTDTLVIDVELTGITGTDSQSNFNTIRIYPNPASEYVIINTGDYERMSSYMLQIINTSGQVIFENLVNQPEFRIDVNTFGSYGTFFVNVFNDVGQLIETRKLILQ